MSLSYPLYSAAHDLISSFGTNPFLSLPSAEIRPMVAIDNTIVRASAIRMLIQFKVTTSISTGSLDVYLAGSLDKVTFTDGIPYSEFNGTVWAGGAIRRCKRIARIATPVQSVVYTEEFEIPPQGITLPKHMGIVVVNNTGAALDAIVGGKLQAQYVNFEYA